MSYSSIVWAEIISENEFDLPFWGPIIARIINCTSSKPALYSAPSGLWHVFKRIAQRKKEDLSLNDIPILNVEQFSEKLGNSLNFKMCNFQMGLQKLIMTLPLFPPPTVSILCFLSFERTNNPTELHFFRIRRTAVYDSAPLRPKW